MGVWSFLLTQVQLDIDVCLVRVFSSSRSLMRDGDENVIVLVGLLLLCFEWNQGNADGRNCGNFGEMNPNEREQSGIANVE
jgi:hypothetical protein